MVEESIIESVRRYLHALHSSGLGVRFGVLFGSWASGKADTWSDIDLMVVSSRFDRPSSRKDIDLLWHVAARSDSRIEPIPCGLEQWEHDTSSAIIEIARREGTQIFLDSTSTASSGLT